jgi:hypothetical protein
MKVIDSSGNFFASFDNRDRGTGRPPPSHTTGHVGPHPAVRLSPTKGVSVEKARQSELLPVGIIECFVKRWCSRKPPVAFTGSCGTLGPVLLDPALTQVSIAVGGCLPLLPHDLSQPAPHPFVQLLHVHFGLGEGEVIHPAADEWVECLADLLNGLSTVAPGQASHFVV